MKKRCIESGCKKKRKHGHRRCCMHVTRRWRQRNPHRATYLNLKANSKRRGKRFKLTFEQFMNFDERYDYIENKGITAESMTIDCRINDKGYVAGNIFPMSLSENASKGVNDPDYQPF